MNVYILSPNTVPLNPHLFPQFIKTWEERGWVFVDDIRNADLTLLDLHSRIGTYNQEDIDWVVHNTSKVATFCEWDRGNLSTDIWPNPLTEQQKQVFREITNGSILSVHFCRLLNKSKFHRVNIFPYEKTVLYQEPPYSADDLFSREIDICYIANSSPSRLAIAKKIVDDGRFRCEIRLGEEKIPFNAFVDEHRRAKFFISSGAGGYTDERCQHLFSISAIIRERTDQLLLNDFTHLQDCLRIDSPPTKADLDAIYDVINDKEALYDIYKGGYDFMTTYYSPEYIATNIAETIEKHLK